MLRLILITGFLGAGKTTFLQKLLLDARARQFYTAVIINEFGTVDIDGVLLRATQVQELASISGGCACCAGQDEFLAVLGEIATRPQRPDYVVIEASGVADPVSILENLVAPPFNGWVRVEHLICLADASNPLALEGPQQPLLRRQVALADLVVLNKTDLAEAGSSEAMHRVLSDWNQSANVQSAVAGQIDFEMLWAESVEFSGSASNLPVSPTSVEAHTQFCPLPHPIERDELEAKLRTLSSEVWRVKGFVRLRGESGLFLVQWSAGRGEISAFYTPFGDDEPPLGLVFIGARLDMSRLQKQFGGHAFSGML